MFYYGEVTLEILLLSTYGLKGFAAALAFFLRIFKYLLSLRAVRKYYFFGISVKVAGLFFSSSLSSDKSSSKNVKIPKLGLFCAVFLSGEAAFGLLKPVDLLSLFGNLFPGV